MQSRSLNRKRLCFFALLLILGCGESTAPYADKSVDELVEMLDSSDPDRQVQGAFGLSLLKQKAKPAIPSLLKHVESPHPTVRQNVALALGQIQSAEPRVVAVLSQLTNDPKWQVRRQAALSLGNLGPQAKVVIPKLKGMRRDREVGSGSGKQSFGTNHKKGRFFREKLRTNPAGEPAGFARTYLSSSSFLFFLGSSFPAFMSCMSVTTTSLGIA